MIGVDVIAVNAFVCPQGHVVSASERRGIDEIPHQDATLIQECRDDVVGLGTWKIELFHCLSHNDAAAHGGTLSLPRKTNIPPPTPHTPPPPPPPPPPHPP